jgi:hypothetical protein
LDPALRRAGRYVHADCVYHHHHLLYTSSSGRPVGCMSTLLKQCMQVYAYLSVVGGYACMIADLALRRAWMDGWSMCICTHVHASPCTCKTFNV